VSKPKPPTPVDPSVTIGAQTQANAETARLQANINNVNTIGPDGKVIYEQTSPDRWTQTTTLSPDQQKIYDASTKAQQGALGVANDQVGRVASALGQEFNYDGLPALQSTLSRGNITGDVSLANAQTGFAQGAAPITSVGSQSYQNAIGAAPDLRMEAGNNQGYKNALDPSRALTFDANNGQSYKNNFGAGPELTLEPGNRQSYRNTTDPGAQVRLDAGNNQSYRNTFDQGQQVQGQVGPTDFTQDRNDVTDAVVGQARSRLDPYYNQQEDRLRNRLANQGISQNDTAYSNAMGDFGRDRNDAYNQAIYSGVQQGAAEQQALFGQKVQQGQFANEAAGQQYGQGLGALQAYNQATEQQNAQKLAGSQFYNQAAGQQFGQGLEANQFYNQATDAQNNQALAGSQFRNQTAAQQYAQNQGQAQFYNQATAQQNAEGLARSEFYNQTAGQQFGQNLAQQQFYNEATDKQNSQALQRNEFYNQAANQSFDRQLQRGQFYNDATDSQNSQALARGEFYNQGAAQQYAQNMGAVDFSNQATAQNNATALDRANFQNQAQNQTFNQGAAAAQFQNQARTQGSQERAYAQQLPINELSALLGLGQVSTPQGIQYSPLQVGQTDALGSYALNAQQQNAAYQAKMANFGSLLGGLSTLGSAAITKSDRRLKRDIRQIGFWNSIPLYYYRYVWDNVLRIGVMAQDVLKVKPEAVILEPDGYYAVDYGML
jgi:hypothetical protein